MKIIEQIEQYFGHNLPKAYKKYLLGDSPNSNCEIHLYSPNILIERNECYETKKYAPHYINIGDSGGGEAFIINLKSENSPVYLVGHGSMNPNLKELVSKSFMDWELSGFIYKVD